MLTKSDPVGVSVEFTKDILTNPPPPAPLLFELLPPLAAIIFLPIPVIFLEVTKIVPPEPALRSSCRLTFPPLASMMDS